MKQNPTSDFQHYKSWYNVNAWRWNNVETTLHNLPEIAFWSWKPTDILQSEMV